IFCSKVKNKGAVQKTQSKFKCHIERQPKNNTGAGFWTAPFLGSATICWATNTDTTALAVTVLTVATCFSIFHFFKFKRFDHFQI
ncbi:MAG: hypothetical protein ACPG7E_01720, partial [Marinirhabdus sp.]